MGLFDSLKKMKDSLISSKKFDTTSNQTNHEVSFDSLRKDMASKSSGSLSHQTSNSATNTEELFNSVLKCMGWKVTADGEYLRDFNVPNEKVRRDEAFHLAEQLYESGDIRAIYLLVSIYLSKAAAEGKNYDKKCIELLKEGVAKYDIMSLRTLGMAYANGNMGLAQSFTKCKEYMELAAQSGAPSAFTAYADLCFMLGNVDQGIEYLEEAINGGSSSAYLSMGDLYLTGNGVQQNLNKAKDYYTKAVELGRPEGYCKIGFCYNLNGNKEKAIDYFKRGAKLSDPLAMYMYSPYTGDESVELQLLRQAYSCGLCFSIVFAENPNAPMYTYRCDMGTDFVEVRSHNPKCPEVREVTEAYFVKYGKKLVRSKLETEKYKILN